MFKIISLLTDFGQRDPYAGVMKGVIYNICNNIQIVDLCHEINPQDVFKASWVLSSSYKYFSEDTIFVCIVDPGVGSERKKLLLKTDKYYFIAPDNGLLTGILNEQSVKKIVSIENEKYWLKEISSTFHGRDIFAPVAAHLASGINMEEFGPEIDKDSIVKLKLNLPEITGKTIIGEVVYIDQFGNLITNIPVSQLKSKKLQIKIKESLIKGLKESYNSVKPDEILTLIGSYGNLEISCNCGNCSEILDIKVGEKIFLEFLDDF